MMHVTTQQNPTYFNEMRCPGNDSFRGRGTRMAELSNSPIPAIRGRLESRNSEESDVFLMNDEVDFVRDGTQNSSKLRDDASSESSFSPKKNFGKKFTQLFWKPKSKSSVGSDKSSISGLTSPTFTPDSSLSIYTNSLDSDSHSSSHSTSTSDPIPSNLFYMNTQLEDQFCTYSFDDCQSYTTNMYYNVGEGPPTLSSRTLGLRPRNNSVPITSNVSKTKPNQTLDDCSPMSYYNTNFSTFPNPRRHSIAMSSTSSSNIDNCNENTRDGYLVPIETKMPHTLRTNALYMNESNTNTRPDNSNKVNNVHDDTVTSDVVNFGLGKNFQNFSSSREFCQQSSNDSSSTIVDAAGSLEKPSRNKTLPHPNRILSSLDCEPYCSLCASSAQTPNTPFLSKAGRMDFAIVSCHECFFSQRAEGQLKGLFAKNDSSNGQKLDIRLQSYDLKEIDQHKVAAEIHRSKVQIVIISNHFLDRLRHEATVRKKISPLNRVLRSNRVVAVLVSLSSTDIIEGYQNVLARFREWHSVELRATSKLDADFCKAFTDQVTRIYNVEMSSISNFSVFPKKVTKEQPKIMVMLKNPIESGDSLRIEMTRGKHTEYIEGVITTNPYTAIVRVPEILRGDRTALIEISVVVNSNRLGTKLIKCEYQAKQFEEDIIERMAQTLPGFRKVLDEHISQKLSHDLRSNIDFSLDPELELMNDALICRGDEFPTTLHFAAYYGLEQTVWAVLDQGDGLESCSISNDMGDTPLNVACARGFEMSIGQMIKDYQEVTVSCRAFQFVKDLYERHSEETEANSFDDPPAEDNREITVQPEEKVEYTKVEFAEDDDENVALGVEVTEYDNTKIEADDLKLPEQVEIKREFQVLISPTEHQEYNSLSVRTDNQKLFAASLALQTYDVPPPPVLFFDEKPVSPSGVVYYDTPRPAKEDYCIPPTDPKPVLPEKRFLIPKGPVLTRKTESTISSDPDGYIFVDPSRNCNLSLSDPDVCTLADDQNYIDSGSSISAPSETSQMDTRQNQSSLSSPKVASASSKQVTLDPTEEELVELMNGFKNNVYSMRELELLFANWKTRSDVQRDFRDRQKQLKSTREHYKKIQENIRRNNKNFSPLERFLKFIPGSRKKHSTTDPPISPPFAPESTSVRKEPSRKISSDRGSVHSSGSSPDSSPSDGDSDKSKGPRTGNVFWKNPLDRRFVASYIPPTDSNLSSSAESKLDDTSIQHIPDTPPPRPFKKPSLVSDCPPGSPPASPFLNKRPPPIPHVSPNPNPAMQEKSTPSKGQRKISKGKNFQPPAPPPPPRSTKNPQPFSYVSYKSNATGTNNCQNGETKKTTAGATDINCVSTR